MKRSTQSGFTLLEILVATTLMGLAVVGLLSSLSTSLRSTTHITDTDRMSQVARNKMEELLIDQGLPFQGTLEGAFNNTSGWTAQIAPFETPPIMQPGIPILQRIALTVWWTNGRNHREFPLEAYRIVEIPRPAQ